MILSFDQLKYSHETWISKQIFSKPILQPIVTKQKPVAIAIKLGSDYEEQSDIEDPVLSQLKSSLEFVQLQAYVANNKFEKADRKLASLLLAWRVFRPANLCLSTRT